MQDQLARGLSAAEAAGWHDARAVRSRIPGPRHTTVRHPEPSAGESSATETDAAMSHYRALARALDAYDESDA